MAARKTGIGSVNPTNIGRSPIGPGVDSMKVDIAYRKPGTNEVIEWHLEMYALEVAWEEETQSIPLIGTSQHIGVRGPTRIKIEGTLINDAMTAPGVPSPSYMRRRAASPADAETYFKEWWDENIAGVSGPAEAAEGLKEFARRVWYGAHGVDF